MSMSDNDMKKAPAMTNLEGLVLKSENILSISMDLTNKVHTRITRSFGKAYAKRETALEPKEESEVEVIPDIQQIQENLTTAIYNTRAVHACIESVLHQGSEGGDKEREAKTAPINEMREKSKILLDTSLQTRNLMESFMSQFVGPCTEIEKEDDTDETVSSDIDLTNDELDKVETQFNKMKYMIEKL